MDEKSRLCKKNIRESHLKIMNEVGKSADLVGEKCLVVGGFVRDCLTNKRSDDLDFVCTDIDKVSSNLTKRKRAKNITSKRGISGINYRTNILMFGKEKVDLVEPRKEKYSNDSIKPVVSKGNFQDDAIRRDFTVNTLQIGVSNTDWMKIYDPTKKGLADLEKGILRTPRTPKITFKEDPTRMLRAIRFSSCHDLDILPNVSRSIKKMSGDIGRVTPELIHKELMKGSKCDGYFRTMYKVGIMKEIFPEVVELEGLEQKKKYHTEDALEHSLRYVEYLPDDPIFKIAGLLHDIGKYDTDDGKGSAHDHEKISAKKAEKIAERLKFSRKDSERLVSLVKNHMRLHDFPLDPSKKATRRFIRKYESILPELEIMSRADVKSDSPTPKKYLGEIDTKITIVNEERKVMRDLIENKFKLAVNGYDIMNVGYKGKDIGIVKNDVEKKVIDGELPNNRRALLKYLNDR